MQFPEGSLVSCLALLTLSFAMSMPTHFVDHKRKHFFGCESSQHALGAGSYSEQVEHGRTGICPAMTPESIVRCCLSSSHLCAVLLDARHVCPLQHMSPVMTPKPESQCCFAVVIYVPCDAVWQTCLCILAHKHMKMVCTYCVLCTSAKTGSVPGFAEAHESVKHLRCYVTHNLQHLQEHACDLPVPALPQG